MKTTTPSIFCALVPTHVIRSKQCIFSSYFLRVLNAFFNCTHVVRINS